MDNELYFPIEDWARTPTWNTSHPLDIERFNRAIMEVYDTVGRDIDLDTIRSTIQQHAAEPIWPIGDEEREEVIQKYMERADAIIQYLKDTRGR